MENAPIDLNAENHAEWFKELMGNVAVRDLTIDLMKQTGSFVSYAYKWARARARTDRMKAGLAAVEAELQITVREKMTAEGIKATEAMVKAAVIGSDEYNEANELYFDASEVERLSRVAVDALQMRADMLRALGHLKKEELDVGLKMMNEKVKNKIKKKGTREAH